jgi:hypothetical protein
MTIDELNQLLVKLKIKDIIVSRLDIDIDEEKTVLIEIKIINENR